MIFIVFPPLSYFGIAQVYFFAKCSSAICRTNADSNKVEIDSDVDSVVVTWWETNQTSDTPVMRVSNDNGATFGPMLTLATNGTIGEGGEAPEEE